jgi:Ca2+-binding EF-hand superfamily protein
MSSVGSVSSSAATNYTAIAATQRRHRPDPAKMADDLFSQLDTSGKGYIEQSDLESALSGVASTRSGSSASEIFTQLDSDGDGKVTKDELSTSIAKLAESLDSQYNQSRVQGGMPPPPPPSDDQGFTKDELSSQLTEIGSSDPSRSSLISKIVANFDKADSNQDGKVSFQEAQAYDQSTSTSASSGTTSSTSSTDTATTTASENTEAQIFRQIMELMRAYRNDGQTEQSTLSSLISTVA